MKRIVPIPGEVINYIQRLDYEALGYRSLIKSVVLGEEQKLSNAYYANLIEKHQEKITEFQLAMQELREEYTPEEYRSIITEMTVDYSGGCLIFSPAAKCNKNICKEKNDGTQ
ncbi:hypothetical protein DFR58_10169 [Anaerobacterium chartisolvens]|uniref:Uncharacterized protein n=1 Tax=Anaerobacterium chartisolvens TaxID=1297424 RepID=A0A369BK71_9FIRM|nr:hypothetical protein [Anaerobacterium chartisolvens]RCX20867.1 hypothetical protein DFR58_10169 [Anaerobacterium chartisolvens]